MRTIIHGDFGLHNLIFKNDHHAVLTDFETTRIEWRLVDLVSTLSRSRSVETMYNLESVGRFMAGYQSIDPVPEEEWKSLPDVWRFLKLRSVFINWNSYFERGGDKLSSAVDACRQAAWAKDNHLTLLKLGSL
jgi:Ser/Thr protein kinase RdoA (MazF antagonist)